MPEEFAKKETMETIHKNIYANIDDIKSDVKDIKYIGQKTLVQTTKTNGRVSFLEKILWRFIVPIGVAVSVYTLTTIV